MTIEQLIKNAQDAEKAEDFQQAFILYTKAIERQPDSPDLYSWRGVVLFHLDKKEDALSDMDKAVDLQPDYSYRYSSRAYIKASLMLTESAIEDYKKCVELDPSDSIAYNNMGLLEQQLGWNKKAEKNFNKADTLENVLKDRGISSTKEQKKEVQTKQTNTNAADIEEGTSRGRIIKNVFTKKQTFKEFVQFIKNGFKLKQ